jgi:LmbE family N-acetylglucosaminyl deacetylase
VTSVLVVSPHLDDAVLSIGGRIADQVAAGATVTVFTVFAGVVQPPFSPVAREYHELWGLPSDPVGFRRGEDTAALGVLGATARHGDFPDCIYRRDGDGWLITPEVHPYTVPVGSEPELQRQLGRRSTGWWPRPAPTRC